MSKAILTAQASAALAFLSLGCVFVAPYWLFDGCSFLISLALGFLAVQRWKQGLPKAPPQAHDTLLRTT